MIGYPFCRLLDLRIKWDHMIASRRIIIAVTVIGLAAILWIALARSGDDAPTSGTNTIELPLQIAEIAGVPLEDNDPLVVVLTLNCVLSSMEPGCSSNAIFASMGDCVWNSDRLELIEHQTYQSGYEMGRWELRMWSDGPLWISTSEHLPNPCESSILTTRQAVGSIHISRRPDRD